MSESSERSADVVRIEHDAEGNLFVRVRAEFREMPGLRLTLLQASRLFDIEPARCERILGALVDAGHLETDGRSFASPCGDRS